MVDLQNLHQLRGEVVLVGAPAHLKALVEVCTGVLCMYVYIYTHCMMYYIICVSGPDLHCDGGADGHGRDEEVVQDEVLGPAVPRGRKGGGEGMGDEMGGWE